jgi:hypothetical protein
LGLAVCVIANDACDVAGVDDNADSGGDLGMQAWGFSQLGAAGEESVEEEGCPAADDDG